MNIDYSRYANAVSEAFQEKSENVGAEERSKAISEAITGPFSTDLVRETLQPIIQKAIGTVKDTATTAVKGTIETAKQTATDTAKGALQTAKQTIQKAVQPTINEAERAIQATQSVAPDLAEEAGESLARSAETSFGAQTITEDVVPEVADELGQIGGRVAGEFVSDVAPEVMQFTPTLTNLADDTAMAAIDAMPASESLMARLEARGISQLAQVGDTIPSLPDLPGLRDQLAPMRELMRRTQPPIEEEEPYELPPRPTEAPPEAPPELGEQAPPTIEDAGQQATQEIGQAAEGAAAELGEAGAEAGAGAAAGAGAEVGEQAVESVAKQVGGNVAKGIGGDLANLAEGSSILDEIPGGAVVTGILALGSLFAGIFGHANEAPSINPSTQFGIGF
jgi:hypothetical protein